MSPYVFQPKKENKNRLYTTPCLNVTSCIKIKNGKQIRNKRLYDRNRKKYKSSLQAQKKSIIKIKILYVSFQQNLQGLSVSLFLLPSVCVHPQYFLLQWQKHELFSSLSVRLCESVLKVSCNFSSMTFSDFNSLISFAKVSVFLVLASEASFSFLSARSILCLAN